MSCQDPYDTMEDVGKWARYQNTHERNFERALNQLLKLREHKTKQQIGFESLKQAEAKTEAAAEAAKDRQTNQQTRVEHDKLKTEILTQKLGTAKSQKIVAEIKGAQAIQRHLGPEGAAAWAQTAA